jgi:hypothetical protein
MRAYVEASTPQVVEARFTYLGSTGNEARLGSGELRRQFGLKLRAQDPCNLVYAMWRIEPESKLVVSLKSNPGQNTSAESGNRGYRNIKPQRSKPVPMLRPGEAHTLRGELEGAEMRNARLGYDTVVQFLNRTTLSMDEQVDVDEKLDQLRSALLDLGESGLRGRSGLSRRADHAGDRPAVYQARRVFNGCDPCQAMASGIAFFHLP